MRRNRRRPKVVWLPPDATNRIGFPTATNGREPGAFTFGLDTFGVSGAHSTFVQAVTADSPSSSFQTGGLAVDTLADIYSSGYRLRRIVGKCFVGLNQSAQADAGPIDILVTCGFIVLRVDATGNPLALANAENQYAPSIIDSWSDPWIWRRSWLLTNFVNAAAIGLPTYGENNVSGYGSVQDGPHIDQKTARTIGNEERLFFVADAMVRTQGADNAQAITTHFTVDVRFVASLRQMAGNRRNASR